MPPTSVALRLSAERAETRAVSPMADAQCQSKGLASTRTLRKAYGIGRANDPDKRETCALPEVPLVSTQNVAGQQHVGRGMRNHGLPYSSPSNDTHAKKKTCDAPGEPISAV